MVYISILLITFNFLPKRECYKCSIFYLNAWHMVNGIYCYMINIGVVSSHGMFFFFFSKVSSEFTFILIILASVQCKKKKSVEPFSGIIGVLNCLRNSNKCSKDWGMLHMQRQFVNFSNIFLAMYGWRPEDRNYSLEMRI